MRFLLCKANILIFSLFLVLSIYSLSFASSEYVIIFVEGHHPLVSKIFDDIRNKYLAEVTIFKDGEKIGTFRGSTLPDSRTLYQYWGLTHSTSPTDLDLVKPNSPSISGLLYDWSNAISSLEEIDKRFTFFDQLPEGFTNETAIGFFETAPVLQSGIYHFVMGYHKRYDCYSDGGATYPENPILHENGPLTGKPKCYGVPYSPRLLGMNCFYECGGDNRYAPTLTEYDWSDSCRNKLVTAGAIQTLTKNEKHNLYRYAIGINIHQGRRTLERRNSKGCLTINPDHWEDFCAKLPHPKEWIENYHKGYVIIDRYGSEYKTNSLWNIKKATYATPIVVEEEPTTDSDPVETKTELPTKPKGLTVQ